MKSKYTVTTNANGFYYIRQDDRFVVALDNKEPYLDTVPRDTPDDLKPLVPLIRRCKTAAEAQALIQESLMPQAKKFTAVPADPLYGMHTYRIENAHKFSGYLYLGGTSTKSAKDCVVRELAGVIDALNAAPSVAVAQAIIDAHLKESLDPVKVDLKVTVEDSFTVAYNAAGQVKVDCKYWQWVNDDGEDAELCPSPFDHVADRLNEVKPKTIAAAVAVLKEFQK